MRKAIVLLFSIFVLTVVAAIYADLRYAAVMPGSPDPANGRINRLVVSHGRVVFVNDRELRTKQIVEYLQIAGIAVLGVVGAMILKERRLKAQ